MCSREMPSSPGRKWDPGSRDRASFPYTVNGLADYRNCSMPSTLVAANNLDEEVNMPEKETIERAREEAREGKSPSTQAGEFVREEMHHIREGKHGAASTKQAIAIGLSKARRAGVKLQAPRNGKSSARTTEQAQRDYSKGQCHPRRKPWATRSRATSGALKKQGHSAASHRSLARQARSAAKERTSGARHNSAVRASRTRREEKLNPRMQRHWRRFSYDSKTENG
jgi:hypothetical protein